MAASGYRDVSLSPQMWTCNHPGLVTSTRVENAIGELQKPALYTSRPAVKRTCALPPTLCMWSRFSGLQYSWVTGESLLSHSAAVEAWQPCATTLPSGQPKSVHRSRRRMTYCSTTASVLLVQAAAAGASALAAASSIAWHTEDLLAAALIGLLAATGLPRLLPKNWVKRCRELCSCAVDNIRPNATIEHLLLLSCK
jgi:hypothetical protein